MLKMFPPLVLCVMLLNSASFTISKTLPLPFQTTINDSLAQPPEKISSRESPKSALFRSDMPDESSNPARMNWLWLWFGFYILSGLIFGGLSGYVAVSKGLPPHLYFFIGFFLSVAGYVYVLTRASSVNQNVPAGLTKVPETYAPAPCEKCGYANHPAAKTCAGCGTRLHPALASDMDRLG